MTTQQQQELVKTLAEMQRFIGGRFFGATFKTKKTADRTGVFKLRGFDSEHLYVFDVKAGAPRTFMLAGLRKLKCGQLQFSA